MYADDTQISICASTPEELSIRIGYVCEAISACCQRNRLILNEKKTKYINFNIRRPLTENLIPLSASIKYLGTYIDSNLSWTCHVDHSCKQLIKAYYAILQMKYTLGQPGLLNIDYIIRDNKALFDSLDINHKYGTRHGNLYAIPPHKTASFKDSPYYNCIICYNSLPKYVRDLRCKQYKKC